MVGTGCGGMEWREYEFVYVKMRFWKNIFEVMFSTNLMELRIQVSDIKSITWTTIIATIGRKLFCTSKLSIHDGDDGNSVKWWKTPLTFQNVSLGTAHSIQSNALSDKQTHSWARGGGRKIHFNGVGEAFYMYVMEGKISTNGKLLLGGKVFLSDVVIFQPSQFNKPFGWAYKGMSWMLFKKKSIWTLWPISLRS